MEDTERSTAPAATTRFAATTTAFGVAAATLLFLLFPKLRGNPGPALAADSVLAIATVFILLALRRGLTGMANTKGARTALLVLCILFPAQVVLVALGHFASPVDTLANVAAGTLALTTLTLFLFTACRVWQAATPGMESVAVFALLAAAGYALAHPWAPTASGVGAAIRVLAYTVLGVYFIRAMRTPPKNGTTPSVSTSPRPGWLLFAAIVAVLSIILALPIVMAHGSSPGRSGPLAMIGAWLLAPQWILLERLGLADYPALLLPLALLSLAAVLLPAGLRLMIPQMAPRWAVTLFQILFLFGYIAFAVSMMAGEFTM